MCKDKCVHFPQVTTSVHQNLSLISLIITDILWAGNRKKTGAWKLAALIPFFSNPVYYARHKQKHTKGYSHPFNKCREILALIAAILLESSVHQRVCKTEQEKGKCGSKAKGKVYATWAYVKGLI